MANLNLTIQEARRQLVDVELAADNLLATLNNSSTATPQTIVTNAMNALQGYEEALTKLQPVMEAVGTHSGNAPLPPAVLNALWKKAHSLSTTKRSRSLPEKPATTLDSLLATFRQNFEETINIEILPPHIQQQQQQHNQQRLLVKFQGVFVADILLETLQSIGNSSSRTLDVHPIDINIRSTEREPSPTPPSSIQQVKTAAIMAVLEMKNTTEKHESPLEMLLLWLALCAARIKGSSSTQCLKLDLQSASYVYSLPKFSDIKSWKEAWEQAEKEVA